MKRNRILFGPAILAILGSLLSSPAASAVPMPDGYYKSGYSDNVYWVINVAGNGYHVKLTESNWIEAGRPAPSPAPTEYVKYPWSPTSYAVTYWPDEWQWERLSFAQWAQAGFPFIRNAGYIGLSEIYKFDTSDELFVRADDGQVHKLTGDEWSAADRRAPNIHKGEGFVKLSWAADIFYMPQLPTTLGRAISADEWADDAYPTPIVITRFAGDRFIRFSDSPTIYYDGPTIFRSITQEEWVAAGSPPVVAA